MTTATEQQPAAQKRDGRHDFDFYVGTWNVRNRRLRERLTGCTDWEEFDGVSVARSILGGIGNTDEITLHRSSGPVHGTTLRLYDPDTGEWRLYWADGRGGSLQPPMVGRFENGRGAFYCQEPFEGHTIFSRYIWSDITPTSCRWEQAFSTDGGYTWETNWIMESTRVE